MSEPPFIHDASISIRQPAETIRQRWFESDPLAGAGGGWPLRRHGFFGRRAENLAWVIAAVLAAIAVGNLVKGVGTAWDMSWRDEAGQRKTGIGGDRDMLDRAVEYQCFRRGVYPNHGLAGISPPKWLRTSPYPPYALPMFAIFFEPAGVLQGRVLIEVLSVASLVVMGCYGYRALRFAGPASASIGAIAGAAIMGNSTALSLGQFSIISMGCIVGQIILLERGRPVAAGICWALAMVKPQIAAAFIPLFVVNRGWVGLLAGCSLLGLSTLFSCWWTDLPPTLAMAHWFRGLTWLFAMRGQGLGPGALADWLRVDPLLVHVALITVCGTALVALSGLVLRFNSGRTVPLLPLAGVCAVLGELLVYHYHYDNVMLWPSLISILALAAAVPAGWSATLATLLASTLWIPHRVIVQLPFHGVVRAAIWLTVAAVLTAFIVKSRPDRWVQWSWRPGCCDPPR